MKWIELSDNRLVNLQAIQSVFLNDPWRNSSGRYGIYFFTDCNREYFMDFPNEVRRDIVYRKLKEFLANDTPLLHFQEYGE